MKKSIFKNKVLSGQAAAVSGAEKINEAIRQTGQARIIVATGSSQFEMLRVLVKSDVDWSKVTVFHLDEYIGLGDLHPASFRLYLKKRFENELPTALNKMYYLDPSDGSQELCENLGKIIKEQSIDVAFVGIGENGHLAFNDPPADFHTEEAYTVVELDKECRQQQVNEGWFPSLEDVPQQAISMTIKQIMKSKSIICTVPGERKAKAVQVCTEGEITPLAPASILQKHQSVEIFLDEQSASLLSRELEV